MPAPDDPRGRTQPYIVLLGVACVVNAFCAGVIWSRERSRPESRVTAILHVGAAWWGVCEIAWNLAAEREVEPVGEGQSLGLGIALEIVHGHGGHIDVESEPDRGTTFRVRLPVDARRGDGPAKLPNS